MKRSVAWLGLLLAACSAPATRARPGGIVSTNPCADLMLVALAPERITAISHYSHDPAATSLPLAVARRFPVTAGTAEEVIALRPALVVSSKYTPPATQAAYARAGLKVLLLDAPRDVAASEAQVRQLAAAVGAPGRGEVMVARIERAVAAAAPPPQAKPPGTLLFLFGTIATGPATLLDDLMHHAGLRNAAGDYGLTYTGAVALETIVARPPALLLTAGSSRAALLRDRVLARMNAPTRSAIFPRDLINCGGPAIIPAITRLAQFRRGLS